MNINSKIQSLKIVNFIIPYGKPMLEDMVLPREGLPRKSFLCLFYKKIEAGQPDPAASFAGTRPTNLYDSTRNALCNFVP